MDVRINQRLSDERLPSEKREIYEQDLALAEATGCLDEFIAIVGKRAKCGCLIYFGVHVR